MAIIIHVKRKSKVVVVSYRPYSSSSRRNPMTHLMKYGVPVVLALLILHYQSAPEDLFQRNPAPVWCFVAATAAYWLAVGATKQRVGGKWERKLRSVALAFGILSAISLLSMFLPYPASLLPLLTWMPVALLLTWAAACRWICRRITTVGGLISFTNKPPIFPV